MMHNELSASHVTLSHRCRPHQTYSRSLLSYSRIPVTGMKPTMDTMKPDVVSSKHPPPGSLGTLLQDLAENTAMHGLPHVQRANSKYRKIFWVVVLMLGTGEATHE